MIKNKLFIDRTLTDPNYLINNGLFNTSSFTNITYSPQTNKLSHVYFNTDQNFNLLAMRAIYQGHPPGFECNNKTANAVTTLKLANADTGATGSYLATRDIKCLQNVLACSPNSQIHVEVANGEIIISSHVGELNLPDNTVIKAFIFPKLSGSLLSVSQLIDSGFSALFDSEKVEFIKNKKAVFSGTRDPLSRLWMVDLANLSRPIAPVLPAPPVIPASVTASAAPAVRLQTKEEHVRYWHACFGFPSKSTLVYALQKWLTVPGLTAADVKKHLPNIVNTALGHLDATR